MKIEVSAGLDIISIGLNDLGSYFRFHHPITMVWSTNEDTMIKYICQLPYNEIERQKIFEQIQNKLTGDFTNHTEELHEILNPLFRLFPNGEYELNFDNGITNEKKIIQAEEYECPEWDIQYAHDVIDLESTNKLIDNYKIFQEKNNYSTEYSITEWSTTRFRYDRLEPYIATQALTNLDEKRVQFFEEKIKNNERPFAILICADDKASWLPKEYFILDGHHKLEAYQNLNINPALAIIERKFKVDEKIEFNVEKIADLLYPWQVRHILDQWEEKHEHIPELLKKEESKLHKFIRNGNYREYHYNGNLKFEAFYINDSQEGPFNAWFANGQRKCEGNYTNRIKTGIWKTRYEDGRIEYVSSYDDQGNYHGDQISYNHSGKMMHKQSYVHGNQDGYAFVFDPFKGTLIYEHWYEDGVKFASKMYDSEGNFTSDVSRASSKEYVPMPPPYIKKENLLRKVRKLNSPHRTYNYKELFLVMLIIAEITFYLVYILVVKK